MHPIGTSKFVPDLRDRLRSVVGAKNVLADESSMAPYLADWRGRYRGRASCVTMPGSTEEVAACVAVCAAAGVPIVPQGGNTGLVGGAVPGTSGHQVLLNLSRMNRVRAIDLDNNTITVDAGCVLAQIQQYAEQNDRLFPLSLASEGSCQIGGNLSTNAGGVHVLRYGNMRDLTLGLEVVLADGRTWEGLRGLRKDNTGYDLKQLFIGAEGTLGIITGAVLKLFPRLRERAVAWIGIETPGAAVDLLGAVRACFGEAVTAFEIVGRSALDLVLTHIPGTRDPLTSRWPWMLLVEIAEARSGNGLGAALAELLAAEMDGGRIGDAVIAQDDRQAKALWRLRESISEAQRIEGFSIKHDVAVPVSRISGFLVDATEALRAAFGEIRVVAFGHIGDGNLHYNLSLPDGADNEVFVSNTLVANQIVHDLVAAADGTISAEHGIGQLKRLEIRRYKSQVEMDLFARVKVALDPHRHMNPGKLV